MDFCVPRCGELTRSRHTIDTVRHSGDTPVRTIVVQTRKDEPVELEPRTYAWIIDGRLAVAERPGGGGRSHRVLRRQMELDWWADCGVRTIVSGMRSKHGLLDAALQGFQIRWNPLIDPTQASRMLAHLIEDVTDALSDGGVLVHVDRPGEWLAAVDGALRLQFGLAATLDEALRQVREDGLPVGPVTLAILGARPDDVGAAAWQGGEVMHQAAA